MSTQHGPDAGPTGQVAIAFCAWALVVLGLHARALAVDYLIPAKVAVIKPGKLFKFVSTGTFTLPDPGTDNPTSEGGSLCFQGTTGGKTYTLDAACWKGLGPGGDGSKGFKCKDATCKAVIVKENVIKGVCKPDTGDFGPLPEPGPVVILLAVGSGTTNYCAECGGTPKGNDAKIFKRKECAAPGACSACLGGATTTTTTTTTTTLLPPVGDDAVGCICGSIVTPTALFESCRDLSDCAAGAYTAFCDIVCAPHGGTAIPACAAGSGGSCPFPTPCDGDPAGACSSGCFSAGYTCTDIGGACVCADLSP
jgi:hypothetical protein